jgi:hypothetical protein
MRNDTPVRNEGATLGVFDIEDIVERLGCVVENSGVQLSSNFAVSACFAWSAEDICKVVV